MNVLPVYAAAGEGDVLADAGARRLGVGKTAAAARAATLLAGERPDLVLLFGVCGAYPERHLTSGTALRPGDLCLVTEDLFGDEGAVTPAGFRDLGQLGLEAMGPLVMDPLLTDRAAAVLGAPAVRAATVSTCSGTEAASAEMARRTGAQVETMEGAAVAWASREAGIPVVQLRAVSNLTGDRDRGEWDVTTAAANVQAATLALLEALRG